MDVVSFNPVKFTRISGPRLNGASLRIGLIYLELSRIKQDGRGGNVNTVRLQIPKVKSTTSSHGLKEVKTFFLIFNGYVEDVTVSRAPKRR